MDAHKPVAVGISDSAPSRTALQWAAARARRQKVPLAILHVLDDRWMAGERIEALPYIDVLRKSAMDMLEEAGETVRSAEPDLQVSLELLEGSVGASLGKYSENASMLVLGSSGHSRGALTDRALQAAATAESPVAVVGAGQGGGQGVVVGVDGSRESTQAVAFAAAEADALGEELTVLYAFTGPNRWIKAGLPSSSFAGHVVEEEQAGLGSPGIDELRWLKPVYPGDTLHVRAKIVETRPSQSKPQIGSFRSDTIVTNQDDVPVMRFTSIVLIQRRPSDA